MRLLLAVPPSVLQDRAALNKKKPGFIQVAEITLEAIVEAVDYDAKKVTLKDANSKSVTIDVKN